jgi:hypothetical protein
MNRQHQAEVAAELLASLDEATDENVDGGLGCRDRVAGTAGPIGRVSRHGLGRGGRGWSLKCFYGDKPLRTKEEAKRELRRVTDAHSFVARSCDTSSKSAALALTACAHRTILAAKADLNCRPQTPKNAERHSLVRGGLRDASSGSALAITVHARRN